jgi:hypothetical protein
MRHRVLNSTILVGIALTAAACATFGLGGGSRSDGSNPIAFKWRSIDSVAGPTTPLLPDSGQDAELPRS